MKKEAMINDGGPAFPVWELNGHGQPEMTGFGMTLRDFFAAKAMAALIAEPVSDGGGRRRPRANPSALAKEGSAATFATTRLHFPDKPKLPQH